MSKYLQSGRKIDALEFKNCAQAPSQIMPLVVFTSGLMSKFMRNYIKEIRPFSVTLRQAVAAWTVLKINHLLRRIMSLFKEVLEAYFQVISSY